MPFHVRDGATWRTLTAPAVRVGGTWRNLTEGWVRVGGVWRQFYSSTPVALVNRTIERFSAGANAFAGYRLHSDGTIDHTSATSLNWAIDGGTWRLAGASADYQARATLVSGALQSGTLNTWQVLSTTRAWSCSRTTVGTAAATILVEIRSATTLTVLASATINLLAERA